MEDAVQISRILVVDDDKDSLELFVLQLGREDRQIITLHTPQEALTALENGPWDVLITDIMMPEIDGFTIIARARELYEEIPCIAITGYGTVQNVKNALETGCFGYINKPFDWTYLNDLVDKGIRCFRRYRRFNRG